MLLPTLHLNTSPRLSAHFMPHQVNWIEAEDPLHAAHKTVFALAEKSVRIGWTRADAFKNVRKRLRFPNRDYLFVTKDYSPLARGVSPRSSSIRRSCSTGWFTVVK